LPATDRALLEDAARAAGDEAMRFWRARLRSWEKPDGSGPVTEADLAVNALLADRLRAARPGYGWLSEESADDPGRAGAEAVFVVDPIDGTRAFIAGENTFAVSLAVVRGGQVTAAAVMLPARGNLYSAEAGGPAMRDGTTIAASDAAAPEGARVLTTAGNLAPAHWPGGVPAMRRSFRPSLAYRLCLVAEGRHDAMLSFRPSWEWDIAAGALIAEQAGATVTDAAGSRLRFNTAERQTPGIMAAAPRLHGALIDRLRRPAA
jgi:myo-inositol-1(or 4)-monophosphatase